MDETQKIKEEELRKVNEELDFLERPERVGYSNIDSRNRIRELETARKKILLEREESWRIKSRAIWLLARDQNTKFFQKYAKEGKTSILFGSCKQIMVAWCNLLMNSHL